MSQKRIRGGSSNEEGLNRTHYGLARPKEIVCDLFANLIWRYRHFNGVDEPMSRTDSAFLFVGPPRVGKTSLAISIAENLSIPYHKVSLGGMRDEAALRGHGFTYEGSKPGAIVQGLIEMGIMNGIFIMDEADKTETFTISTLLEILDPEQNYLFHDKFTMTTVDIDLSNCHCLCFHALARPRSAFHARQLNPQHPVVGFCLTHNAEPPIVRPQKRDFLSPHPF